MIFFEQLAQNKILIVTITAWAVSCLLKGCIYALSNGRFLLNRFFGSGGMPSSHSATVVSLAAATGLSQGFNSAYFSICVVLALVVMYDASGIRRAAGQHAKFINMIMDVIAEQDAEKKQTKLKEILGHTPLEVLAGAVLGAIIAAVSYSFYG